MPRQNRVTPHGDRLNGPGTRCTYQALLAELPAGAMVDIGGVPWLIYDGGLLAWTPGGYRKRPAEAPAGPVTVITPRTTVAVLAAGYRPIIHPSAFLSRASGFGHPSQGTCMIRPSRASS